jgi:hypothetical protein
MSGIAPPAVPGYSGKPLAAKLGVAAGMRLLAIAPPDDYAVLLGALPPGTTWAAMASGDVALAHLFVTDRAVLADRLAGLRRALRDDATLWVSWPKKASKVPTTVTEDVIRELALPLGYVDVKVCAVSGTWSGLKLVVRLSERRPRT